jgi:deoxycytidylate deaminase
MSKKQESFLDLALKVAEKSSYRKARMGCVITKGGRIVGIGINKLSPGKLKHPAYGDHKNLHAELDAIRSAEKDSLHGSVLYIAGYTKANNFLLSRPCEICMTVIAQFGIRKVIYHDKDRNLIEEYI